MNFPTGYFTSAAFSPQIRTFFLQQESSKRDLFLADLVRSGLREIQNDRSYSLFYNGLFGIVTKQSSDQKYSTADLHANLSTLLFGGVVVKQGYDQKDPLAHLRAYLGRPEEFCNRELSYKKANKLIKKAMADANEEFQSYIEEFVHNSVPLLEGIPGMFPFRLCALAELCDDQGKRKNLKQAIAMAFTRQLFYRGTNPIMIAMTARLDDVITMKNRDRAVFKDVNSLIEIFIDYGIANMFRSFEEREGLIRFVKKWYLDYDRTDSTFQVFFGALRTSRSLVLMKTAIQLIAPTTQNKSSKALAGYITRLGGVDRFLDEDLGLREYEEKYFLFPDYGEEKRTLKLLLEALLEEKVELENSKKRRAM